MRPARTPKESSTAFGGFSSSRLGVWAGSSVVSLAFSSGVALSLECPEFSVHWSAWARFWSGSHTVPIVVSLRTIASRLVRKVGVVEEASASSWMYSGAEEPHIRRNCPEEDQAA